jgi:hypothetical protein
MVKTTKRDSLDITKHLQLKHSVGVLETELLLSESLHQYALLMEKDTLKIADLPQTSIPMLCQP